MHGGQENLGVVRACSRDIQGCPGRRRDTFRVALSNPLLPSGDRATSGILFARRLTYDTSHIYTTYYDGSRRFKKGGGIIHLSPVRPDGRTTNLTRELPPEAIYRDPDVSWDGTRVLFQGHYGDLGISLPPRQVTDTVNGIAWAVFQPTLAGRLEISTSVDDVESESASLLIAFSLRKDPYWKRLFSHTLASSALAFILISGRIWLDPDLSWFGLYERILVANTVIWVGIMAIRLLRLSLSAGEALKRPVIF